jgi:calcium/calmodulin-dependent protein kinase I
LQSFKHKNIIKFINSYVHENHFYTVMQCAKGGELTNYLEEKKILSEFEARRVFKQLHDSVKYMHSKNVVHRDLKPNNILFLDEARENLVVKIKININNNLNKNIVD